MNLQSARVVGFASCNQSLPLLQRRAHPHFQFAVFVMFVFVSWAASFSQTAGIPNAANAGMPINGVFSGGSIDSVQLNNGNLHVDIPLIDIPGIGIPIHIHLIYDNKIWNYSYVTDPQYQYYVIQDGPITRISYPGAVGQSSSTHQNSVDCGGVGYVETRIDSMSFVDETGTSHQFPVGNGNMSTSPPCDYNPAPLRMYAMDSSGIMADRTPDADTFADVILKDGTKYTFPSSGVVNVEDSNGNKLTVSGAGSGINTTISSAAITDTIGRTFQIIAPSQSNNQTGTISYVDQNGTTENIRITYVPITINVAALCGGIPPCPPWTAYVPSVLTLQNGVSTYSFQFQNNGLGDLLSLTLPTGGTLSWTYGNMDVSGDKVLTRTVAANGQSAQWRYQYAFSQGGPSTITVTDPAQNDTQYTCTVYGTHPLGLPGGAQLPPCYMTQEKVFNGAASGGNVVVTKNTAYTITGTVLPTSTTVTWPSTGQVAETDTTWQAIPNSGFYTGSPNDPTTEVSWGNPLSRIDYDYGSGGHGPLLRNTQYSYLQQQNSAYVPYNIADRVSQISVYNSLTMNSSTLVSQKTTSYDQFNQSAINGQGSLTATSGTTNHDYTNFNSSAILRGLPTSVTRYVSASSPSVTTYVNFNDLGNETVSTDGRGNSTKYTYGPQNAFLSTTTFPTVNGVSQIISENSDLNTGLLVWRKDQNQRQTSYTYDSLMRPLTAAFPDGGQTAYSYHDVAPVSVQKQQQISSTLTKIQTTVLDGLGRQAQTQLNSDPSGATYTDTTYDAMGRTATVSNPYRATSDDTYGITHYVYDALGRVCVVAPADTATTIPSTCPATRPLTDTLTSYSGNCTTVTDEAGKARKSCSDALGRLINVWEDPSGFNYETDYTYDALDNLLSVNQKGDNTAPRARGFHYDSLSRLTSATNPESGTITYNYDADGNLQSKIAPKPNQILGATVTTTYTYDALNRLTQKSYDDGTTAANYGYDGTAPSGCTPPTITSPLNLIGRRTGMCDASGATAWSYDPVGRISVEQRKINSVTKNLTYYYASDGEPSALSYPSGNLVHFMLTAAGRTWGVTDSGINYIFPETTFTPNGALDSMHQQGAGTDIQFQYYYNKRMQLVANYATTTVLPNYQLLFRRCYDYHQGTGSGYDHNLCNPPLSSAGNNGNLYQVTNLTNYPTPIALVQHTSKDAGTTTSSTLAFTANNTAGNWIAVVIRAGLSGEVFTVSDSRGNTYHQAVGINETGNSNTLGIYYAENIAAGSNTITVSDTSSATLRFAVLEYSGVATTASLDVTAAATGHSSSPNSGNTTTTAAGDLLLGEVLTGGTATFTAGTGYAIRDTVPAEPNTKVIAEDQLQASAGTASASATLGATDYWAAGLASFKAASGSGNTDRTQNFTYDNLNRISQAYTSGPNWGEDYTIDPWGNLTNRALHSGKTNYELLNTSALANNQLTGFGYDAAGNMTTNGSAAYTYDAENRLTNTAGFTYVYDGDGKRLIKCAGTYPSCSSGTLYWTGTGSDALAESDLSGNLTAEYYFFQGMRVVRKDLPSGQIHDYMNDPLGTARMVVTPVNASTVTIDEDADYYPYGGEIVVSGSSAATKYKFTGKERDTESGLDNFGARYFTSSMGRFMTPDWAARPTTVPYAVFGDPQSLNLYNYVRNDPVSRADPDGHYDDKCGGGDKKCEKGVNKFDKQVQKDLKSKDPKVRAAAAAWGTRGDHNGIGVKFVTQQQMDADAHTAPGFKTDAMVTPGVTADHKLTVNAEFSESLSGSSLGQTVAHEGSHIEDDATFVNSYNSTTGKYFSGANFTHFDTEFQAFEAGSGVKSYSEFQRGPKGYQQLQDYIYRAYPNADDLVFSPAVFPQ
jgi:RHS repeat-associated protein